MPTSVSSIDCTSWGITDVEERCAFRIAPADFGVLLRGYDFYQPAPCGSSPVGVICDPPSRPETSHAYGGGPAVGRDFAVAYYYVAEPKRFEHGGSVTVLTDRTRSMVMVDVYVE